MLMLLYHITPVLLGTMIVSKVGKDLKQIKAKRNRQHNSKESEWSKDDKAMGMIGK